MLAAGARRVAVGRAICDMAEPDPGAAAGSFGDRLRAAWGDEMDAFTIDAVGKEGRFRTLGVTRDDADSPGTTPVDTDPEI